MRFFLFIAIIVFFSDCSSKEKTFSKVDDDFKGSIPSHSNAQYFPTDSIFFDIDTNQVNVHSFVKKWYSETLFNLQEPVLYNYTGKGEVVRLLWLRAFDNPVVIRVNKFNDTTYANIKELQSRSYDSKRQKLLKDTNVLLDSDRWNEILSTPDANNFWNASIAESFSGKDGITWFLECKLSNRYHAINRWDDGNLSSKSLNLYADKLINIANTYISMRSSK
jgi:hypothetical protein